MYLFIKIAWDDVCVDVVDGNDSCCGRHPCCALFLDTIGHRVVADQPLIPHYSCSVQSYSNVLAL